MEITETSLMIAGQKPVRRPEWTVKDYAKLEQVTPITVRRWISKGAVAVRRTPGGGIRILGTK